MVDPHTMAETRRLMCVGVWANYRPSAIANRGTKMANKEWTVKDLIEALKKYPSEAKVYYEMGPNGPGTIGKAQYVEVWGEGDEMAVLLDR
jgi:hypothetical protein